MAGKLVLRNGSVVTMRSKGERFQALAVEDGRITALGSDAEIGAAIGPGTQVIDLAGRAVLPGLIDCHVHLVPTGLGLLQPLLRDCKSVAEVLDIVAGEAANAAPDEPIWAHGLNQATLTEARYPTREELDRVAPRNPVAVVHMSHHSQVLNTRAWELLQLPDQMPGMQLSAETGRPTGLVAAQANILSKRLFSNLIDDATKVAGMRKAASLALSVGVTTLHALDGGLWAGDRDIPLVLAARPDLPVRTLPYFQTPNVAEATALGLPRIGGCLWVDGAAPQRTAAFFDPYDDDHSTRGVLYFTQEETNHFVWEAHRAGLQISRHAIGDAAIEQMLTAFELAQARLPRVDHRHRIEHFAYPTEAQVERALKLGIVAVMAPVARRRGAPLDLMFAQEVGSLGEERAWRRYRVRSVLESGLLMAACSDSDVSPIDPLSSVSALASHPNPDLCLSTFQALSLYTANAARAGFEEGEKGALAPGLAADLVVLDRDPLAVRPQELINLRVEMTIVGGEIKFGAQPTVSAV